MFYNYTSKRNYYTIEKGNLDEKHHIKSSSIKQLKKVRCIAKNKGKKNATTATQQTLKELNSLYNSRLRSGYYESIEEAVAEKRSKPLPKKGKYKSNDVIFTKEDMIKSKTKRKKSPWKYTGTKSSYTAHITAREVAKEFIEKMLKSKGHE